MFSIYQGKRKVHSKNKTRNSMLESRKGTFDPHVLLSLCKLYQKIKTTDNLSVINLLKSFSGFNLGDYSYQNICSFLYKTTCSIDRLYKKHFLWFLLQTQR